ncbi:unnamed protein product, partial [Ectocarpus sp. 12 AP-2014]
GWPRDAEKRAIGQQLGSYCAAIWTPTGTVILIGNGVQHWLCIAVNSLGHPSLLWYGVPSSSSRKLRFDLLRYLSCPWWSRLEDFIDSLVSWGQEQLGASKPSIFD